VMDDRRTQTTIDQTLRIAKLTSLLDETKAKLFEFENRMGDIKSRLHGIIDERDEARRVARELLGYLNRGAWDMHDKIAEIEWMLMID